MSHEGNVQFASGQPLHSPISLGNPNGPLSHNLLGGSFQVVHSTPNGPVLSTSSQQSHQSAHPAAILKLLGLPPNLSQREAGLIFSLAIDDIISIDYNEKDLVLTAVFKNPNTCITAARILDGKFIFGGKEGPVKVEYDVNFSLAGTPTAFENLRLSNPKATPPGSQQMHQQPGHQVSVSNSTSSQLQHSAGAAGIDNYQKRASVGNQRSRFLFSDPFSGQTTPTNSTSGSIDLSDLTGKSLLLMKLNDGREHETTSRDPWGSHSQGNIGYTSNTQTPGLNSVQSQYDWGSGTTSQTQQLLHNSQAPQIQSNHSSSVPQQMPPYAAQVSADRRKTSSFFNGPPGHFANQLSLGHESQPQQSSSLPQRQSPTNTQPLSHTDQQLQTQSQHPAQSVATIKSQGPTKQQQPGTLPSLTIPPGSAGREGSKSLASQISSSQMTGITAPTSARSPSKDLPELSLLARVPPPANPADQNPPCNTLYVGNLPPDATESELRSLFAPQNGFRRLSFRTKNQSAGSNGSTSSHNHGPMCFVEFEDVAYATVALAELYGRPLPRPSGSNGKGGIRLSFSKNPLGVRGPGNPRRTSTNSQPSLAGSGNNGVGNYGYSNYH